MENVTLAALEKLISQPKGLICLCPGTVTSFSLEISGSVGKDRTLHLCRLCRAKGR